MRVIFTDIDGVLNPHWKSKWGKSAISYYNRICKEFDLKPVITSTWRLNHSLQELQDIFTKQGIEVDIYDYTPHIDQADRGIEIKKWLDDNICDFFVVIDDVTNNIEPHVNNVIKCRSWLGITSDEYLQIKKLTEINF